MIRKAVARCDGCRSLRRKYCHPWMRHREEVPISPSKNQEKIGIYRHLERSRLILSSQFVQCAMLSCVKNKALPLLGSNGCLFQFSFESKMASRGKILRTELAVASPFQPLQASKINNLGEVIPLDSHSWMAEPSTTLGYWNDPIWRGKKRISNYI